MSPMPIAELPATAQAFVGVIGYGPTVELIRHFGGQRIRFAKTVGSAAFEAVAEVVGPLNARKLGEAFSVEETYVPRCLKAMKGIERQQIAARFDALLAQGHGSRAAANLLAGEFSKSYRAIEIIVNSAPA